MYRPRTKGLRTLPFVLISLSSQIAAFHPAATTPFALRNSIPHQTIMSSSSSSTSSVVIPRPPLHGTLTARLIPSHLALDVVNRPLHQKPHRPKIPRSESSVETPKEVVTLRIRLENPNGAPPTEFEMRRNGDEPSIATLRRLEVTIAKHGRKAAGNSKTAKRVKKKDPSVGTRKSRKEANAKRSRQEFVVADPELTMTTSVGVSLKKKTSDSTTDAAVILSADGLSSLSSAQLWRLSELQQMELILPHDRNGDDDPTVRLKVLFCPPTIVSAKSAFNSFAQHVYLGVPLSVRCELLFATEACLVWSVGDREVTRGATYTPTSRDLGQQVSVTAIPYRVDHDGRGCEETFRFERVVEDAAGSLPILHPLRDRWADRREDGLTGSGGALRVLSYNLLADLYASKERNRKWAYPHCPPEKLIKERRMPLLLYEILSYDPDVVCLQEVDESVYETFLRPALKVRGYEGFYGNKISSQREGCAMFWSEDRFELEPETTATRALRDLLQGHENEPHDMGDGWESMRDIRQLLNRHHELHSILTEKVGTVAQFAILRNKRDPANKKVAIANTHLFWHPMADHIRAIQLYAVCRELDRLRRTSHAVDDHACLLCGDLNSDPLSGAVTLMHSRAVTPDHKDCWKYLDVYKWNNEEEEEDVTSSSPGHNDPTSHEQSGVVKTFLPPTITLPSHFPPMVSGCQPIPDFTNYAKGFIETLDWVFASQTCLDAPFGLVPKASAPMPSREEVSKYVAMPNEFMPSDHVSVLCELEWSG